MIALDLHAGALRLSLRPDLGGCVAGLWLGELPVLWSADPASLASARPSGCFPLAPYSNRLGFRRFRWQDRDYATEANSGDSPHSMHGVAWQHAWEVLAASADSAELRYLHRADGGWPFDFELRQRFHLTADALEMRLHFTNTAALAQPVGLGWHPYFPKRAHSRLQIELSERWESDEHGLPTRRTPQPGMDADLADLAFDHCFEGWRGAARLHDETLQLSLSSSLPYLVVYTPQDKGFYCVEPVSHVNDAIHLADPLAHGLRELAPGDGFEAWMKLAVTAV
ncbi:MAG TPA: aldose 1-epimerase [Ideonella sp.]|nr:aldose 1-epimerase [Ideonella sp.]